RLARLGAHVIGYDLDAMNSFVAFEVYTDDAIADFSWIVAELLPEDECDIQVRWFGAKGDGTLHEDGTDDTAAIQNAIAYSNKLGGNPSVVFGKGIFV